MKLLKLLLIVPMMLIISFQVLAGNTYFANESVQTVDVSTKAKAYELGLKKLALLHSNSPKQLQKNLGGISAFLNVVRLDEGGYVTVLEKMGTDGQFIYTGVVHVSVLYQAE